MKKLLCVLFFFPAISLFAQLEEGDYSFSFSSFDPQFTLMEGLDLPSPNVFGFSFSSLKGKDAEESSDFLTVGMSFSAQHFVSDQLSAGLNLGFFLFQDLESDYSSSISLFLGGPEFRYYIPIRSNWYGRLKLLGSYGRVNEKYDGEWGENPVTCLIVRGGAGFCYFPSPWVSIDLGLGYQYSKTSYSSDYYYTNNSFIGELGFSLYIK